MEKVPTCRAVLHLDGCDYLVDDVSGRCICESQPGSASNVIGVDEVDRNVHEPKEQRRKESGSILTPSAVQQHTARHSTRNEVQRLGEARRVKFERLQIQGPVLLSYIAIADAVSEIDAVRRVAVEMIEE
jgi:hypothetical protein